MAIMVTVLLVVFVVDVAVLFLSESKKALLRKGLFFFPVNRSNYATKGGGG